jgi:NAD(P)-dependent dehydrogenase (short-subunit alcohol dehydrogenase family)
MSRYAAAHADPQGPADARPTAIQIIHDEGAESKLIGKVIVITGISAGIGIETARALALTDATLFLTARDLPKARSALGDILYSDKVHLIELDLNSFDSVRAGAAAILSKTDKVNILVNNAGIMAVPDLRFTKDGHELQFGTNHLAHFVLFQLLKPALLAASTPTFHSRVVAVSSAAHRRNGINDSDNYNFQKGGYSGQLSYDQSKTANVYMANEIERRYGAQGLHATSVHPGAILTELTRHMDESAISAILDRDGMRKSLKSTEQGAATTVWAAIGKELEGTGGKYLQDCRVGVDADVAPHTYNPEAEARLWRDSLKLVGVEED